MVEDGEGEDVRQNYGPLGHAETTLMIQAQFEGLTPQQILVRDLMVSKCGFERNYATPYVRELSGDGVNILKEVLQQAGDPVDAFNQFDSSISDALLTHEVRVTGSL